MSSCKLTAPSFRIALWSLVVLAFHLQDALIVQGAGMSRERLTAAVGWKSQFELSVDCRQFTGK